MSEIKSETITEVVGTVDETNSDTTFVKNPAEKSCCGFYDNNREALGWAIDVVPRGVTIMGNVVFSSTALLNLAKKAAGCQIELLPGELELPECTNKVYGIRPSSLLTTIVTLVGLCAAVLMPVIGSIIDHTKYRRAGGRISAIIMTIVTFFQMFISEKTWFFIAILQVISAFFYITHVLVAMAYLPELTNDSHVLTKYNGNFIAVQYGSMVLFLVAIVATQVIFSIEDDVQLARIAQAVSFSISICFFGYAWSFLFRSRPASQRVPENQFLITTGFRKLYNTATTYVSKNPAIKWFLVSLALTESSISSFTTISITFMTDQLQFTSSQNGIAILILLLGTIPGAYLATLVSERFNPVLSLQIALFLWVVNTLTAAMIVKGPEQTLHLYVFSAVWGLVTGWTYPMERTIYCTVIPQGQEAELMGVYLFASQIISWLPPLVSTAINEAGINMRVSIASLSAYFSASFCALILVSKDYKNAVAKFKRNVDNKVSVDIADDKLKANPVVKAEMGIDLES